jgi:AraC-like DNA-binding protein
MSAHLKLVMFFFLGSNLPHTFQKSHENLITSAIVVHFKEDFWGEEILNLPESKSIRDLLQRSVHGLKISGEAKEILQEKIKELETKKGFWRITKLCECLSILAETKEYVTVSTQEIKALNPKDQERIDKVFHYTMENFKEPIQLSLISKKAGMSIPAFCNYFKKRTKKTYIDFVNEVRVGHACKLLLTTQMSVLQICFECGFNTVANFNRQFLKIKKTTPSQFRKKLEVV